MKKWLGIIGLASIVGCSLSGPYHSPAVISDITEDNIKLRMDYNMFESPNSFQRRWDNMQQEAQRGCNLYGQTKQAVPISKSCVRWDRGGSCDEDEFLFACAN